MYFEKFEIKGVLKRLPELSNIGLAIPATIIKITPPKGTEQTIRVSTELSEWAFWNLSKGKTLIAKGYKNLRTGELVANEIL